MDITFLSIRESSWAIRAFSSDVSHSISSFISIRVLVEGCWGIATQKYRPGINLKELAKRAIRIAQAATRGADKKRIHYAEVPIVKDRVVHSYRYTSDNIADQDVLELLVGLKGELREKTRYSYCEAILEHSLMRREYLDVNGTRITEVKPLTDIVFYLVVDGRQISTITGLGTGLELLLKGDLTPLINKLSTRARAIKKMRRINPLIRGSRYPVVLSGEVACALFHECIGHMLEADRFLMSEVKRLPLGVRVAPEYITIYDDPSILNGFGSYAYDDEGVKGRRKVLIEDGYIRGFLFSRTSAGYYQTEPTGNGRSYLNVPRSMMSNIYVRPGDWRLSEMIEETREGFYLDGVIIGRIDEYGICSIEVESSWYIKRGEIITPTEPLRIQASVNSLLNSIEGVGREIHIRPSFEKGIPVSEYAPPLKLTKVRIF